MIIMNQFNANIFIKFLNSKHSWILISDEVGLDKIIEVGMIFKEIDKRVIFVYS
jgi:hypothetical protein